MSYRKLNEELISIVEKNIDPKFRDYVKQRSDRQRSLLNKEAAKLDDPYYADSSYYQNKKSKLKKLAKAKNQDADRIYKYIGKYLDVENCTIETIPTEDLKSGKLRKLIKSKLNKDTTGILLQPISGYSGDETDYKSFRAYICEIEKDTDKLIITPSYGDGRYYMSEKPTGVTAHTDATNTFMADLNAGRIEGDLYFAYGKYISDVRKEKGREGSAYNRGLQAKIPTNLYRFKYDNEKDVFATDSIDKSGYLTGQADLLKRLAQYKQSKGSYQKEVEEIYNAFDNLYNKYKEAVNNYDPRKSGDTYSSRYSLRDLHKQVEDCSYYIAELAKSLEKNDGNMVSSDLKAAKNVLKRYNLM